MKKLIIVLALTLSFVTIASAQPRAIGARFGRSQLEASYQHSFHKGFIEADLGLDLMAKGGFVLTGIYDFEFAHCNWTPRGEWTWYAGPGATVGYVYNGNSDDSIVGAMAGLCGQLGLEYAFWFPLAISADIRPTIGYHFGDSAIYKYNAFTFIPTISVRYRF